MGASALGTLGSIPTLKAATRKSTVAGIREIPILLEDTPELQQVGGFYRLEIQELDKDILVAHTDVETFIAVDIKCTHKGCLIGYKQEMEKPAFFECPCHGSKFDLGGTPINGPAKLPLGAYKTEVKEGELLVMVPVEEEGSPSVDTKKG